MSPRVVLLGLAACALGSAAYGVTEPPPAPRHFGLYDWMGPAPTVVAATVVVDDQKFVQVAVDRSIKGRLAAGSSLLVDLRGANRDREDGTKALALDTGRSYLLLLTPSKRRVHEAHPLFDLVRGTRGARPVPPEGGAALVAAAERLGAIQQRESDRYLWASLPALLEDDNPYLVDAALELYVKFRREDAALVPRLEPLLSSPRPHDRERAIVLIGRVLARARPADLPDRSVVIGTLTARARTDDDPAVRRAATAALAPLRDPGVEETLRTVARDDPDQDVRLEAEKALYTRSIDAGAAH